MQRAILYGASAHCANLGPSNQNLVPVAQDVAIHRATVVAEVCFHIAAIRSLQTTPQTGAQARVRCVAAHVQTSSAQFGQQAAHLLPGQIVVNDLPVWKLATARPPASASAVLQLEQATQMCFAWTNVLPALFNKADSEAEGTGLPAPAQTLKPLFGTVVQDMWHRARVDPAQPLTIDREAVLAALQTWFGQISAVYRDAEGRKRARGRADEALVLATYANSFQVANAGRLVQSRLPQVYQRYRFLG